MRRSGSIRIDVRDVLHELDDQDLLDEVQQRKLITTSSGMSYDADLVREAFDELRCGRTASALSILDRLLNPKWKSLKHCQQACEKAIGRIL